jgi:hypothetical protein
MLQKQVRAQPKKQYTLKDYRNFMKDTLVTNKTTGKLGFDYDNEDYKDKVR